MSVLTLASQDFAGSVAGPMAFSARNKAPETAGEKAGDAFDAALARSENDAPAAADAGEVAPLSSSRTALATDAAPDAVAAPADFARDGALWRDLSAVSGGDLAAKPTTASVETAKPTETAPDAPAKRPAPDAIAKSLGSAGATPPPPAAADNAIASARGIDRKAPVASLSRASGTIPATPATPAEKAAPASSKTPTAQEAESAATSAAPMPKAPTTAPAATPAVDPLAASSLPCVMSPQAAPEKASVAGQTGDEASASAAGAADVDSVARIGAALASVSRRATATGGVETSAAQADIPLAASDAAATSPIHVVARQTWLPPVSPAFSPGLNRQAVDDRATLEAPRATRASAGETSVAESSATVAADAPAAVADTESSPPPGFAVSAGVVVLVNDDSDSATPAVKKPAAAQETSSAAPLAAPPRRDLEITLAPKDLGGLAVRMKSAGDRLEIAFVADKGETARMISDKSATLESQLHGAGLGLGGIDINAASRMEAGAAGTPPASAGAQNAPADPRENAHNAPPRQDFSGRGRQDQSHETSEKTSEPRASNGDRGLYL
jgi:flagellar hook-length control protein FliK